MSLIHADNFNIYGSTVADMTAAGRYAEAGGCSIRDDPDGVSTTKVLRMIGGFSGTTNLRRAIVTPDNKIGIGLRMWAGTLPSNDTQRPTLFFWSDVSNVGMARVILNTNGSLTAQVFDTTSGTFGAWFDLASTPGPVVTAGAWWQIEAAFDGSALTLEVRVEGVTKISCDSTDFAGHLHNGPNVYQAGLYSQQDGIGAAISVYFKDYFWWDGLGTRNNDFLGACLVAELDPTADVSIGGWVPSTGTEAWSILDNAPASSPYVSAPYPVPAPMELTMSDLPADVTSVKGIVTIVRAAKSDGGDGQLQVSLLSGGDASNGADRPITVSQTDWEDFHELDPHTAAPWTPGAVDLATLKLNRTV